MMKPNFTKPKLVKSASGWYAYFRYDGKMFRYKKGLNYIENLKEREKEFGYLCDALYDKLKSGWNPNIGDIYSTYSDLTLTQALEFALDKKKNDLAGKSYSGYTSTLNFFKCAAESLNLNSLPIIDVKRLHVKTILEKIQKDRSWSNKAYNKNLGYLKAIFSELIQWDIIDNNPAHKIKSLSVGEVMANIPPTDEEVSQIKERLTLVFPNFFHFIVTIFHTGIRPDELLQVTIEMVNLDKKEINLPPEITKTDIHRIVPINNHLFEILQNMDIDSFDGNYFLFGSLREFSNRGLKPDKDFRPGPNRLKADTATKLWRKLIKKDLGISANLYSMKHLGGDKKILAGIDLDSLRELYGHTSKRMTARYAKVVKEVYRNNIIEKSPAF